jgi:hypothetical protein
LGEGRLRGASESGFAFEDELNSVLKAEPFVPFNLVTDGGDRYLVESPRALVVMESVIYHYPPRTDRKNILRTNQLAVIEVLDPIE